MKNSIFALLFACWLNILPASSFVSEIKIGMLIPGEEGQAAVQAAELAITRANGSGGYQGIPFRLVVRSTEGPWGAGSKESVSLVFEEKAVAILGSLDGRNAHLAEQAATKMQILFLSCWAVDPTLSQAFVPWYIRCIPNAEQQAHILYEHINRKGGSIKTLLLQDGSYDASYMAKSFIRTCAMEHATCPACITWKDHSVIPGDLKDKIHEQKTASILLFAENGIFPALVSVLRAEGIVLPVITGLADLVKTKDQSQIIWLSPGIDDKPLGLEFIHEFEKAYGHSPGVREAYAYDGVNLILESIRRAGTDPETIRDTLAAISYPEGITGTIQFDEYGNRVMHPGSLKVVHR